MMELLLNSLIGLNLNPVVKNVLVGIFALFEKTLVSFMEASIQNLADALVSLVEHIRDGKSGEEAYTAVLNKLYNTEEKLLLTAEHAIIEYLSNILHGFRSIL